jgi:hypothetical protein
VPASGYYIPLHQSLLTHRKTEAAADALGIDPLHLTAHLSQLWLWGLDNAPDGALLCSERVIARAARWGGDPDMFVAALLKHGWIDRNPDGGLWLHDWGDYGGKLQAKRERNRDRMRDKRAADPACNARATHTQRTTDARCDARADLKERREEESRVDSVPSERTGAERAVSPAPKRQSRRRDAREGPAADSAELHARAVAYLEALPHPLPLETVTGKARQRLFAAAKQMLAYPVGDVTGCSRYLHAEHWRNGKPASPEEVAGQMLQWIGAGRPPPQNTIAGRGNGHARAPTGERRMTAKERSNAAMERAFGGKT